MLVSKLTEEDLTEEVIDKLLFEGLEDTGERVDCIIVLGSIKASKYRVPVAVKAFKEGRADKLMLCGGAVRKFPDRTRSEADDMYNTALALGVPKESIILENTSQNTVENMLCAMLELQRAFWLNKVKNVLLVTTTYHMRRSLALARYLFPVHINIIPCPADDNTTRRNNWIEWPEGKERAKAEALNIITCVKNGVILDFEI